MVAGDFNNRVYSLFAPANYAVALDKTSEDGRKTSTIYNGNTEYDATTFFTQSYPGYDYLQDVEADNIMVLTNEGSPKLHRVRIVNPVVGAPYQASAAGVSNTPADYTYPPKLRATLRAKSGGTQLLGANVIEAPTIPAIDKLALVRAVVRGERAVSDHLPLVVRITFTVN